MRTFEIDADGSYDASGEVSSAAHAPSVGLTGRSYNAMCEFSGAPSPDNGAARSESWNIIYDRLGADDQAAQVADWAQQVAAQILPFTEWQARRIATVFGYNLARVEDLLPNID